MPTRTSSSAMSSRERIVNFIATEGGRIESPDGRGLTSRLAAAAGYRDLGVLNAMLSRLETEGVIRRDIRGRRTFSISLARGGTRAAAAPRKKTAAKKSTATKRATGARKTAKRTTAKRAAKKTAARKTTAKRTAKKATARRATAKRATKKTAARKTTAKRATAKKASGTRKGTKKAGARRATKRR